MVTKPGRMYHNIEGQCYTRKEYMGGIPHCKISQFDCGVTNKEFPSKLYIQALEAAQFRDSAIESARIAATRYLEKKIPGAYHLKIMKYPHHILREHKMATGAGADRVSGGMRAAFGKAVGHAARIQVGEIIIQVSVNPEHMTVAREALRRARMKLPTKTRVITSDECGMRSAECGTWNAERGMQNSDP
mgnify:CR=1 FL=1